MKFTLLNNKTGKEDLAHLTNVEVKLTDTHLEFYFDCKNSLFYSAGDYFNAELYKGDVCEAFICTDGVGKNYYEVEVAPNNSVFLKYITYRGYKDFSGEDCGNFVESKVEVNGKDYKVFFRVPLDSIGYTSDKGILLNIFRIDTDGGEEQDKYLLSLSPTLCDSFHMPDKFIKLK